MFGRLFTGFYKLPMFAVTEETNNGNHTGGKDEAAAKPEVIIAEEDHGESSSNVQATSPSPAHGTSTEVKATNKNLCGICNENEGKYKCPRCYLPYCSVACSNKHKINHLDDEPKTQPEPQRIAEPEASSGTRRPGTVGAGASKDPFAALQNSPELQQLFKKYPNLSKALDEIDAATLSSTDNHTRGGFPRTGRGRGRNEPAWDSDFGFVQGAQFLKEVRSSDGLDGEAVREFTELIHQIMARAEAEQAILKQQAEMDKKLIEQILDCE